MDLYSEASSNTGGRVLAARHITADQAIPEDNNAINTTFVCYSMDLRPEFKTYVAALQMYAPVLWSVGGAVTLATLVIFILSLKATFRRRSSTFTHATFTLGVYPMVATAALIAIVVPRARILAEAIAQQSVMVAMYNLFCLIIAECGGEDQLIRCAEGARLETRVLPCCCWPCCIIPRPELHKSKLNKLRYLVLQMPMIQALIYVIILILWSESPKVYIDSFVYIQPFIAASILFGVWGIIMCVRAAESAGSKPRGRFLVLQMVLLIVKLQGGLVKVLPEIFKLPCFLPLHPTVFINLLHNSVMILEMFLLSLWARRLYGSPTGKMTEKVQHAVVAVLEDTPNMAAKRFSEKEGIQNNSFRSEVK